MSTDYYALLGVSRDATAEESLRWLMREARKYNCLVALHINMFDAYEDSPLSGMADTKAARTITVSEGGIGA